MRGCGAESWELKGHVKNKTEKVAFIAATAVQSIFSRCISLRANVASVCKPMKCSLSRYITCTCADVTDQKYKAQMANVDNYPGHGIFATPIGNFRILAQPV